MIMKATTFVLFLLITCVMLFSEEDTRGRLGIAQSLGSDASVGKQYLLLIAVDKYRYWNPLTNPVSDAREIKDILCSRYFIDEVTELYNQDATRANIISCFMKLQNKLEINDSLLIFFAGHGYLDKVTNSGSWIPVNGGVDTIEQANWLPNYQVRGLISNIKAMHVLLISDSCFAGDILNTFRGNPPDPSDVPYFSQAYKHVSRQVLTSGALESVPDSSEFALQLKMALKKNSCRFLDTLTLYNDIKLGVTESFPLIGNLKDTGHQEGASYLLFLKEEIQVEPTEPPPTTTPEPAAVPIGTPEGKSAASTTESINGNLSSVKDTGKQKESGQSGNATLFSVEAGSGMTIPVSDTGSIFRIGYNPVLALKAEFVAPWGAFGIGILSGIQVASTVDGFSYKYSMYSFPLAVHASYATGGGFPLFLSIEADAGAVFNYIKFIETYPDAADHLVTKPFCAAGIGAGVRFTERFSLSMTGEVITILFDNNLYTAISPVIKLGVRF